MKITTRCKLNSQSIGYSMTCLLLSILVLTNGCQQDEPDLVESQPLDSAIPYFQAKLIGDENDEELDVKYEQLKEQFESFQIYELVIEDVSSFVSQSPNTPFKLFFSEKDQWDMQLEPSDLMSEDYQSYGVSSRGRVISELMKNVYYNGQTTNNAAVTATLDGSTINAMIHMDHEEVFIENVANLGIEGEPNKVIIYRSSDLKDSKKYTCTAKTIDDHSHLRTSEVVESQDECRVGRVVDIITTTTYDFYATTGQRNVHTINSLHLTYINHMQSRFNEFNIKFRVKKQLVITEDIGDPRDHLEFENNVLIILKNYENDDVVGSAYLGGMCLPFDRSYMFVTSIVSTSFSVQTYSHEMGHLFNARHNDQDRNIMNTSSNASTVTSRWHPSTREVINANKFRRCIHCEEPITHGMYVFDRARGNGTSISQSRIPAANIKVGDFDGDDKDDLITSDGVNWYIAYSKSLHRWDIANNNSYPINNVLIGDFDGDGKSDVFAQTGSGWHISKGATDSWTKISGSGTQVSTLAVGDFNGDGIDDIMRQWDSFNGQGIGWYVAFGDAGSTLSHDNWNKVTSSGFEMKDVRVGDYNGDGIDDILARHGTGGAQGVGWYAVFGKNQRPFDSWEKMNDSGSYMSDVLIGDFNNDGEDDVLKHFGFSMFAGAGWYVSDGASEDWIKIRDEFQVGPGIQSLLVGDFTGNNSTDIIYIK
ncbi:FG-GAP-like repeat-containing protein [Reichenbachiella versicolor]|uniref:FG-GAP-like repeat-containing protein n=1 Tax=Reichenbachiella versicolor TaxID=1821036 RepID=UPI000D6EA357|nr:FG-GAP-like repeat-containing protein [Reichenbachiella versicolor]